jgi:N-acetylglucosamine malate deacetylase 1
MRTPRLVTRWVARAKPRVPQAAWPVLLAARSWVGDGPLVGLPKLDSVLVVAPHPDDEAIGAGGTLRLLANHGARVSVLFATDGESTRGSSETGREVASQRRAEAQASCRLLGAVPEFLGLPDGALADRAGELGRHIGARARAVGAQAVFLPWFGDGHADHLACTAALGEAGLDPRVEIWAYETWTPLPANRIVDITGAYSVKEAAVAAHVTAHLAFDVGATLGLNRYRSVHGLMGRGQAEGFLAAPVGNYLAMALPPVGS